MILFTFCSSAGGSMDGPKVSSSTPSVSSRTPSKEAEPRSAETVGANNSSAKGAFWSTQYAQTAKSDEPASRQEKGGNNKATLPAKSTSPPVHSRYLNNSPPKNGSSPPRMSGVVEQRLEGVVVKVETPRQNQGPSQTPRYRDHGDGEIEQHDLRQGTGWQNEDEPGRSSSTSKQKHSVSEPAPNESSFAAFETEYSHSAVQSKSHEQMKDEIDRLNEALRQALSEKSAIASKFEKLTTICRSQRQEIQDLKSALNSGKQQQQHSSSRARASQSFEQASKHLFVHCVIHSGSLS
jgi:AP2-associated kinase